MFYFTSLAESEQVPSARTVILQHAVIKKNPLNYSQNRISARYKVRIVTISLKRCSKLLCFAVLQLLETQVLPKTKDTTLWHLAVSVLHLQHKKLLRTSHSHLFLDTPRQEEGRSICLAKTRH